MFDRITISSTVAARAVTVLAFAALSASTAAAGSVGRSDAVSIPAVIGAAYNDANRADSASDVRHQGGFATAGTVRWFAQAPEADVATQPFYVPSVIGAMNERPSLARSAEDVRHQGGFATAGTVRWFARAPEAEGKPLHTVAAF